MRLVLLFCLILPVAAFTQTKKRLVKTGVIGLKQTLAAGQIVYQKHCLSCHQADGSGVPNMNPPLTRTQWTLGSKAVLIEQVLKGSQGKVEIDGDTFHNSMPPLGQSLSDQQIANVLTYVRNNFGNKASTVRVAEVKTVRAKTK